MNKYEIKAQKQREIDIKRTLMKARVPKDATQEQVKTYLVHYVSRLKKDFDKVILPDELLADPNFLLSLYRANINMVDYIIPNPEIKELQNNVDFMIEYLKIKHTKETTETPNNKGYWTQTQLQWAIEKYDKAMSNPEFIVRLAETFPNYQIIPLIKSSLMPYRWIGEREEKEPQDLARYKECLSKLPVKFLCDQVKIHTWRALSEIPNDIPNYNQLVSAGIETGGFRSLDKLDITQVIDNIDLVVKAYEKDGLQSLIRYIQYSLSPRRTRYYMCHGEEHDENIYDPRYEAVQEAIMKSPEIKAIFDKEKMVVKTKEVKTTYISIESCVNEENGLSK